MWTAAALTLLGGSAVAATVATPTHSAARFQEETPSTSYGGIQFDHLSFEDAISRSERTTKILVILWVDDDRTKEVQLGEAVFGDEAVQRWMAENAIAVRIDGTKRKKDAKKAGYNANRGPVIDILDIARGGRVDRLRPTANSTSFLASVLGIGAPVRPSGETAEEPFSWLAWGNANYRDGSNPQSGRQAVEAYEWCLEKGEAQRPGFRAKYLEFLLQRLALCKQREPRAFQVLQGEFARLYQRMINGDASRADVYDLTRVGFWLRKEEEVRDAFINLRGGGEKTDQYRRWLFATVAPILGRYEQYDEILDVVGDAHLKMFQARIDLLNEAPKDDSSGDSPAESTADSTAESTAESTEESGAEPKSTVADEYRLDGTITLPFAIQDKRGDIIDDASWVYEALLKDGRGKDARDLMLLITTTYPVNKAFGLFIERAQRLQLWAPSAEIADLGMAVLDERGQKRMQRLLNRIPKELPEGSASGDGEKDGQ